MARLNLYCIIFGLFIITLSYTQDITFITHDITTSADGVSYSVCAADIDGYGDIDVLSASKNNVN